MSETVLVQKRILAALLGNNWPGSSRLTAVVPHACHEKYRSDLSTDELFDVSILRFRTWIELYLTKNYLQPLLLLRSLPD